MSAPVLSPYCEAHPHGTRLRCDACAVARAAARPAPAPTPRRERTTPLPTPTELMKFEARWPDRAARQRFDGELLAHHDAVWRLWAMTPKQYAVRVVWALRNHRQECVEADPQTAARLLERQERRAVAHAERRLS